MLVVDGDGARILPAPRLWGLSAADAEERLREHLGPAWRVAAIGPAGERLVQYATVSHDGRHAGRGGLGAVLGSKNIKAVAVRGAGVEAADRGRRAVLAAATRPPRAARSAPPPPSTASSARSPTSSRSTRSTRCPTRNFSAASFEGAPKLAAEELHELRLVARDSCASCTIGCEHIYAAPGGGTTRVEYENVFALGPLCGVSDPDAVLAASRLCDDLGIDTISAGGTLAWAMECAERGLIDAPWLRFGDADALHARPRTRSARATASATCSPRAPAAPPSRSARDRRPSPRT